MAILKTTFTSESGRIRHDVDAPAADHAARGGLRTWFVAVSLVAHAALFFALRVPASSHAIQRARDDLVMFELAPPPPAAPMPIVAPPPATPFVPPPLAERPTRVRAALEAVAANPAPAAEAAAPAAEPAAPAAEPAAAGALPTDAQGALAMATGAGGAGGPLGAGGSARTGTGTSVSARSTVGPGGTGVDRRALALAWKAAVERLLRERASLNYPRSARRAHLGGTVLLSITVDARGHITLVRVDRTSGVEALDEAAVATVADIGAVPPPPPELDWRTRALRMPIEYAVR